MVRLLTTILLACLAGSAPGQTGSPTAPNHGTVRLSFGVYSFKRPTAVYKQFQPAVARLRERMSRHLGKPVAIDLMVSKTYEECLEKFVRGDIDFVRFGPASYVLARQRQPSIQLIATEREDSRGVGLIVVREDSPVRTLADLAGRKFAFGNDQSTIGRYLSQAELVKAGIRARDLAGQAFLDRHDIVYKAVEIGDYDAGALHRATFDEMSRKAAANGGVKLRILHEFDNVSKPWIARAGLPPEVIAALRTAILEIDDPAVLASLKAPGFVPVEDRAFDVIREGMRLARSFGGEDAPSERPDPTGEPAPQPRPDKNP